LTIFVEARKPAWLLAFWDEKYFIFFKKVLDSAQAT